MASESTYQKANRTAKLLYSTYLKREITKKQKDKIEGLLLEEAMKIIELIVDSYVVTADLSDRDDLKQLAAIRSMRAIRDYNPIKGMAFSVWIIRTARETWISHRKLGVMGISSNIWKQKENIAAVQAMQPAESIDAVDEDGESLYIQPHTDKDEVTNGIFSNDEKPFIEEVISDLLKLCSPFEAEAVKCKLAGNKLSYLSRKCGLQHRAGNAAMDRVREKAQKSLDREKVLLAIDALRDDLPVWSKRHK